MNGIIHTVIVTVIVVILNDVTNTMYCAYHIINDIGVWFVFFDFGRDGVPKRDDGGEI